MRFKNKWLNRVTAAVLSIGMALTPVVMNPGVTYADVKDIESPIPVTQSEKAKKLLTKTVNLSGSDYEITAEVSRGESSMKVDKTQVVEIILTSSAADATSSNAIASASNTFKWSANDGKVEIADVSTSSNSTKAKVTAKEAGKTGVTVTATVAGEEFEVSYDITVDAAETPVVPVEEVKLDKTKLVLLPGDTAKVEVSPAGGDYEWKSSNSGVLSNYEDGNLTANSAGTTTLSVTDKTTGAHAECEVTVAKIIAGNVLVETGKDYEVVIKTEPSGLDTSRLTLDSYSKSVSIKDHRINVARTGQFKIYVANGKARIAKFYVEAIEKKSPLVERNSYYDDYSENLDFVKKIDDPDGLLSELDEEKRMELIDSATSNICKELENSSANDMQVKNLSKAVKLSIKDNEMAVYGMSTELQNLEVKVLENKDKAIILYPTKLIFDSSIMAAIYDSASSERLLRRELKNNELTGDTITFYLPIPSTITEKYAQVTHKSENMKDETIPNLEIKNRGTANAYIEVPVTHFSTFEVTFTKVAVNNGNSGSSSSSGGSSSSGSSYRGTKKAAQWARDAKGWRFQNADGTYVTNRWIELSWKEKSAWYRFNDQGYMMTGWFKDADNNWYFMNDRADGTQGSMVTGWRQIAGKWYYFRVTAGGPKGSLVVNATTPDGYKVDGNGAWIQ